MCRRADVQTASLYPQSLESLKTHTSTVKSLCCFLVPHYIINLSLWSHENSPSNITLACLVFLFGSVCTVLLEVTSFCVQKMKGPDSFCFVHIVALSHSILDYAVIRSAWMGAQCYKRNGVGGSGAVSPAEPALNQCHIQIRCCTAVLSTLWKSKSSWHSVFCIHAMHVTKILSSIYKLSTSECFTIKVWLVMCCTFTLRTCR